LANVGGSVRFEILACALQTGGTRESWFDDRAAGPVAAVLGKASAAPSLEGIFVDPACCGAVSAHDISPSQLSIRERRLEM